VKNYETHSSGNERRTAKTAFWPLNQTT
jgi:hypothetical protein